MVKARLISNIKNLRFLNQDAKISYSQEGEDMILSRLFDNYKTKGFYVDIGAHHPIKLSNTHFFYKLGWNGINIDPLPGVKNIFDKVRKRDINLEVGVSNIEEELTYYSFMQPAFNTFSKVLAEKYIYEEKSKLKEKLNIKVHPLRNLLEQQKCPHKIDFMNIDAEGLEYEILISNDWTKFLPKIILLESHAFTFEKSTKEIEFLKSNNYSIIAKSFNTVFLVHSTFKR